MDLDDWSDEQLQNMKQTGNKVARVTWEPPDLPMRMRSDESAASARDRERS